MQARYGIINTAETRDSCSDALLDGRDFRINVSKLKGQNDAENERWRDRDSANALAEDFCKKATTRLENLPMPSDADDATSDQLDAHWLSLMMTVWRLAIGVYFYQGNPFAAAADLAGRAGETDYFRDVIAPMFVAHQFAFPGRKV